MSKKDKAKSLKILNRYKVEGKDFLGQGSFSVVRKGIDIQTGDEVAVKMYKIDPKEASPEDRKEIMVKFKHQVCVLTELKESPTINPQKISSKSWAVSKGNDPALEIIRKLDPKMYFVQLLDYSKDKKGESGNAEDGNVYIILELALYTLDDYLYDRRKCKKPMRMPDVQRVFKSMANMVALLHAHEYVHLDIKPENIMRTSDGAWKLIDVDGAVKSNTKISVEENTIAFTPLYCAPEFARVLVEDSDYVHISRLMDVWSIGLTSLDLLLSQPALEHKYTEIVETTGDCMGYFEWLADKTIELGLPAQLEKVDKDYFNLLQDHILVKDEKVRASIPEVINHPFYCKDYSSKAKKEDAPIPKKAAALDDPLAGKDYDNLKNEEFGLKKNQSRRLGQAADTDKKDDAGDESNPSAAPMEKGGMKDAMKAPGGMHKSHALRTGLRCNQDLG